MMPKAKPRKSKVVRLPEKAESVLAQIKADQLEVADFSSMGKGTVRTHFRVELGDEGMLLLVEALRNNRKLKLLKLIKNKIGDEGAIKLFDVMQQTA